jgi:ribonuclease HI
MSFNRLVQFCICLGVIVHGLRLVGRNAPVGWIKVN